MKNTSEGAYFLVKLQITVFNHIGRIATMQNVV